MRGVIERQRPRLAEGQVAEERAGCRLGACARPAQDGRADQFALDADRVARAGRRRQCVARRERGRLHRSDDPPVSVERRPPDILDPRAAPCGPAEVGGADIGQRPARDRRGIDPDAEGQRTEDRQLRRRVVPVDVGRGVRLGEAGPLRPSQRPVVGVSVLHRAEDGVGGAVDDPADAAQPLPARELPDRGDDRDARPDTGLDAEPDAAVPRDREEARPLRGDRRLVGGHDRAATLERGGDQVGGGKFAAQHLDDRPGPFQRLLGARRQRARRQGDGAHLAGVAHQCPPHRPARARRPAGAGDGAADNAEAEQGYFLHDASLAGEDLA